MKYRCFLFDLDNTLWDFDTNARDCITTLIRARGLESFVPDGYEFYRRYKAHNELLWQQYEAGEITQQTLRTIRFARTFQEYGIPGAEALSPLFSEEYLDMMPTRTALMPHAMEVLEDLERKGCRMALLTNGFKQVQYSKIKSSGLDRFFNKRIFISEEVGYHKPNPRMFIAALTAINGKKEETLMVGDNFVNDIEGAQIFGIDQYYYNPQHLPCDGAPTLTGDDLRDLKALV
ncbi:MAG: YjjG family noncanonical pyrimidine nucleotidase [Bacteroidales bacterium]|jgi:putative hydrolase of the HAD superfamily|nr:YjjG family noncanonical pyrimidine nucleotidase [Bacteroidales bacterium]HNY23457.1 YjjG family noncanonical pyrimidine nucleotidase [Bacteroidales bacterium]HPS24217.1 YjjG family noncanonical pyrimidine nucleotidase [Bacteroidales bacterium]